MNTNWIGGTRDESARREHPTQRDPRDRGQSDEPPAEYYEQERDDTDVQDAEETDE